MFNRIAIVTIAAVFALALYDAWRILERLDATIAFAVVPTLILIGSFLVAVLLGRKTGRQLLLNVAASCVLVLGLVAYVGYVAVPPRPDSASHMHVVFFPMLLGLFAVIVIGVCSAVAYIWPRESKQRVGASAGGMKCQHPIVSSASLNADAMC